MSDAEPLFLINDQESQIPEFDLFGKERMSSDDDIDSAGSQVPFDGGFFPGGFQAGKGFDQKGIFSEAFPETQVVLLSKDGCRDEDCHLPSGGGAFECGTHGNFSFSVSHIAAEKTVHGFGGFHIFFDGFDCLELTFCCFVGEGGIEDFFFHAVRIEGDSFGGVPDCLKPEHFRRQIPCGSGGFLFCFQPTGSTQFG